MICLRTLEPLFVIDSNQPSYGSYPHKVGSAHRWA